MSARELQAQSSASHLAHLRSYNAEAAEFYARVDTYEPEQLEDIVQQAAITFGKSPFLTTSLPNGLSASLSFADVEVQSGNLARYFRDVLNLQPGTVVAVQAPQLHQLRGLPPRYPSRRARTVQRKSALHANRNTPPAT